MRYLSLAKFIIADNTERKTSFTLLKYVFYRHLKEAIQKRMVYTSKRVACSIGADILIAFALSVGTWWTVTGSNSGRNMWDLTVGTNTRWVTRMSTLDQLITLVFSEVIYNV